jgi:nucleoside-diphosphate-sugar epimerase
LQACQLTSWYQTHESARHRRQGVGSRLDFSTYVRYVTTNLMFDNGKAQRLLRWKPEYTMPRGVEEMVWKYIKLF